MSSKKVADTYYKIAYRSIIMSKFAYPLYLTENGYSRQAIKPPRRTKYDLLKEKYRKEAHEKVAKLTARQKKMLARNKHLLLEQKEHFSEENVEVLFEAIQGMLH